jgi:hypothetical protein
LTWGKADALVATDEEPPLLCFLDTPKDFLCGAIYNNTEEKIIKFV